MRVSLSKQELKLIRAMFECDIPSLNDGCGCCSHYGGDELLDKHFGEEVSDELYRDLSQKIKGLLK